MITVTVKTNVDAIMGQVSRDLQRQIPFATAKALTQTAKDAQKAVATRINTVFDKPTPFTQKAVGITPANKATLTSRVFLKDIQAAYLGLQITGGTRTPKKRAIVVPAQALRLNQYGNIPKGKVKALLSRSDTFSGRINGVPGIWQTTKRGKLKLLVLYKPQATYKKRFPFYEIAKREIARTIVPNLQRALADAIRTAR